MPAYGQRRAGPAGGQRARHTVCCVSSGPTAYHGYAREEQVTGEGVAVELPVAGVGVRILARLLDTLVQVVMFLVVLLAAVALSLQLSAAVERTLVLLTVILVVVVYPVVLETFTRGKSVGKFALGLRTVRDDGGPVTARQSLVRALTAPVELYAMVGGPALVCALATPRAKRLGDLAAGTYVIAERHSVRLSPPPTAHPLLAGWAAGADIAALPTGLSLGVRQFLARAHSLTPEARDEVGRRLLAQVLRYVSPPPPPGWHAEYVLAAVLADRRRRDTDRLRRDQALRDRVLGPADDVSAPLP